LKEAESPDIERFDQGGSNDGFVIQANS
jgi:hypothetical protein